MGVSLHTKIDDETDETDEIDTDLPSMTSRISYIKIC